MPTSNMESTIQNYSPNDQCGYGPDLDRDLDATPYYPPEPVVGRADDDNTAVIENACTVYITV